MFENIRKRDGRIAPFDAERITSAIAKAGQATGEFDRETAKKLTIKVLSLAQEIIKDDIPSVEQIQDIVEEVLITSPYLKTAKAYIVYREEHARIREIVSKANSDLVDQYLNRLDWQVNENSNMSFSLQGLNNYISSEISKIYWLNRIYPKEIRQAHLNGDFHIHDLGTLSVYCVGWDLIDLLRYGFKGAGSGKVESKPAKHFRSALGQVVNFFYTLQGEAAGAQAFSNFDTLLAPFIRYDGLSYREVKQAVQEFLFNVNVPTRVGFQTPFTNITLDLTPPKHLANQPVIIGGEFQEAVYGDFQKEMDMLNRAFLEVMLEGDAKGRPFTFPIPTYNITEDFDWDNENMELLWEITAKYGIPYFSNFINSDMKPEDVRSMCCRLRINTQKLERKGGGLFGANPKTGSIGVVTINLPRLAYLCHSEEEFFEALAKMMDLAKNSLEIKRKVLERFTEQGLYPYTKFYLKDIKNTFGGYWKNHFSTIGLIGMNEACLNLLGTDIGSEEGHRFALKTLDFMRERLIQYQEETSNNYNLEATPAEGTSYRLAKIDKEKYPDIVCANEAHWKEGAEPFYTNSTQLPVNYTDDIFEALDLQDELQTKYTGGTVMHLFVGERISDPRTVKLLVKRICEKYRLPYFTVTPTFSICPNHGYLSGEHDKCPECGSETEVYSRVVGYLRPVKQWNHGKKEEFRMRKTFKV
ncbi:ribonucleoside triphosphate reductase [Coprothermobacter proteolyticus]|uniref:ribonucleoside triphosphate reductase n=1 Tax=Coprothermobacter proteolyticus TaxID=35786 RepID=UPI000D2F5500|nr:ribonucleoside triphosphate reductase [Coprothermobacter proteolyticus]